ncbi:MAG: glycosyltransferase family 25 protein [Bdellovibrionales bacterium]
MIKCYVINLTRNPKRLEYAKQHFTERRLSFERIDAVDGSQIPQEEILRIKKVRTIHPKSDCRPASLGCFLSHHKAWQKVADGQEEYAAVFEDDIHLSNTVTDIFTNTQWMPHGFDIIRLEISTNKYLLFDRKPIVRLSKTALFRLRSTAWGGGAYIISRAAAKRLVSLPEAYHDTIDYFLFSIETSEIARSLVTYQFVPAVAIQGEYLEPQKAIFASNIGHEEANKSAISLRCLVLSIMTKIRKAIIGYRCVRFISE